MISTLAAFTLAVLTASSASTNSDTTFAVRPPMRLALNNFAGEILVSTWAKNAVRIAAEHGSRASLQVSAVGSKLNVDVVQWRGIPATVEYRIIVPKWMSLELTGVSTDVEVNGTQSEVNIQSVSGDVTVLGGTGFVTAASVSGDVTVIGAKGRTEVSSVESDVRISGSNGAIAASSVNGEVTLEDIDSDDVEASTISGSVTYDGTIKDGGSYKFSTTNGDVSVAVPAKANATVAISTYSGEFQSEFPVTFTGTKHRKQFTFTLGTGSARLDLESFQGGIQLRRPGSPAHGDSFDYKYEYRQQQKQYEKLREHEKEKEKEKHKEQKEQDEDGR